MSDPIDRFFQSWLKDLSPVARAFWGVFLAVFITGGAIIAASLILRDGEKQMEQSERQYLELGRRYPSQ